MATTAETTIDPGQWDGDEILKRAFRTAWTRALRIVVAIYLVALAVFIGVNAVTSSGDVSSVEWWGPAALLAAVALFPLVVVIEWLLLRRGFWRGMQVLRWSSARADEAWATIDGGASPTTADEALQRLGDRDDERANEIRVAWLGRAGRAAEMRTLLDRWVPSDAVSAACRVRAVSNLAWLEGSVDDLGPAWDAASAIPDAEDRLDQRVAVLVEDAYRLGVAGKDPFRRLAEAHALLGPRAAETDTEDYRRARRRVMLLLVIVGSIPAILLGAALAALWGDLGPWSDLR